MCSAILPCPLCCQPNFQSIDSLRISLVSVTNRPLECPICCDVLYGLDKLTIHLFSHTLTQEVNALDGKYDTVVTNVDSSTHHPSIETKIESVCNENVDVNHQNHQPPCQPSSENGIAEPQCDICGSTFQSATLHRMHLKLVHEFSDEAIQRINESMAGEKDHSRNYYPCHLCAKMFKMKGSLRVHLKVVHSFGKAGRIGLPILDGIQPSASATSESHGTDGCAYNAENRLSNVEVKAWECDICAKSFTTKYFLKKHKRLHTGWWKCFQL